MKIIKKVLKNGLRVVYLPEEDAMATTVLVLVSAGSKYEKKEENGISHFLEHLCFKGTKKRPKAIDISGDLDGIGAQYNAFTSQEYTGYYAKVQPGQIEHAIDLVSDLYLSPTLDASEIEKEKGVVIEEINMYEDMPNRRVGELLFEVVYGDQPAGWGIAGKKEIIRSLTREQVIAYRTKHYVSGATTVLIAGKFDMKSVSRLVSDTFGALPKTKAVKMEKTVDTQTAARGLAHWKESDQTHVAIGLRSVPLGHKDYYSIELLAQILGGGMSSRLFQVVREELGAAYYVRSANDSYKDHGLFEVTAGVEHSKLPIVLGAIGKELKRLTVELAEKAEMDRAKESLVGGLYLGLEKSDEIASFFGAQEVLDQETLLPKEVEKRIRAVTPLDVRRVAKKLFVEKNLNLAMIGPQKDAAEFVKMIKLG